MQIFLIGYMASGKTTMGKQLASLLGYRFIDMDDYIVEKTGKTIRSIFEEHGEAWFRELEHETIKNLAQENQCVIATGGGAPCFHNNMELINSIGLSVYLKMKPEELVARLSQQELALRPLLKDKSPEELLAFIREMLAKREPFYSQATIQVPGEGLTGEKLREAVQLMIDD